MGGRVEVVVKVVMVMVMVMGGRVEVVVKVVMVMEMGEEG